MISLRHDDHHRANHYRAITVSYRASGKSKGTQVALLQSAFRDRSLWQAARSGVPPLKSDPFATLGLHVATLRADKHERPCARALKLSTGKFACRGSANRPPLWRCSTCVQRLHRTESISWAEMLGERSAEVSLIERFLRKRDANHTRVLIFRALHNLFRLDRKLLLFARKKGEQYFVLSFFFYLLLKKKRKTTLVK